MTTEPRRSAGAQLAAATGLLAVLLTVVLTLLRRPSVRDLRHRWRATRRGVDGMPVNGVESAAPAPPEVAGSSPTEPAPTEPDTTPPRRGAGVLAHTRTVLAALLVFVALVLPNQMGQLTAGAFLRIPVEALLGVALLLIVAGRISRTVVVAGGVLLGVMTVFTLFDLGFSAALDRTFDPVLDWGLASSLVDLLSGTLGHAGSIAALIGLGLVALGLVALMALAVRSLSGVVLRRRRVAIRAVAVVGAVWLVCAMLGAELVPGLPVASVGASVLTYGKAHQVYAGVLDQQAFDRELTVDAFGATPGQDLLNGLRGKDVVIAFVESYGRDAVENPELAPIVDPALEQGNRDLAAAGIGARTGYLTSPVAGGNSWMAHATFLSGLWVSNQARHDTLVSGDRLTLPSAFRKAGWRTVAVMPGSTFDWPEGSFYGYQQVYDVRNMGYQGPNLGWASTPDQYTLAEYQRAERANPDHPPLLTEIALVSSHAPWPLIPRMLDWSEVGDGSIYNTMTTGEPREAVWAKGDAVVRDTYARSIAYSMDSLISWVTAYGDDNTVLIVLGDHQPAPIITGDRATRDVPVSIIARDPAVLARLDGWGWSGGLKPDPQAPVWRMDAFRDRFLSAYAK
ncbi:MAG TPA: sulfatase-like hydrolase/transferase [Pseudonocardia sp.]|nr:sulfatase-like hydrolase/transferase [Pseudonocardia sp.]